MVLPALPVTPGEDNSLASTAGGGIWRIFEPGRMPAGRLVGVSDLMKWPTAALQANAIT